MTSHDQRDPGQAPVELRQEPGSVFAWPDLLNELLKGNLTLVVGGLATTFVVLRLLAVAGFSPETAYGILQAQGTGTVIVGTLVGALRYAGPFFFVALIFSPAEKLVRNRALRIVLLVVVVAISAFSTPWVYLAGAVAFALLVSPSLRWSQDRLQLQASKTIVRAYIWVICIMAILGAIGFTLAAPPWMPIEQITFKNDTTIEGYVLSDSGTFMSILTPARRIREFTATSAKKRKPCVLADFVPKTIPQLLGEAPRYPVCPSQLGGGI